MNFDGRRQLIKFDDIMNDQRKSIYERRDEFLASDDLQELIEDWREETLEEIVYRFMPKGSNPGQWDLESLNIVLVTLPAQTLTPLLGPMKRAVTRRL